LLPEQLKRTPPDRALRVLHVIPSIGVARGGPSMVIRAMARGQAACGLEVHVATTDDNGPDRLPVAGGAPLMEAGVFYWIFRRQTRFYTFSWPLTRWLLRRVAEFDIVHIHALFSFASVIAAVCARRRGIPYIIRPLGTLNRWGMHKRHPRLKRLSFRFIESRILKEAAGVQYTSQQEALEARQLGVEHGLLIVPNPVDLPARMPKRGRFRAAHPHLGDGATLVLFLSRLDPKKGLDLLFAAFSRVRESHPDATLVIAGDGDPAFVARLKQDSDRLGLAASMIWTGFLQGEEKLAVLADADVFVLPSYSENFGVAVVEAMAAGLPVIVSDQVGIHHEISASRAGLVVPCSERELADAIQKMITAPAFRDAAGRNGQELAAQFSTRAVSHQLLDVYGDVVVKRRKATEFGCLHRAV
jgi:glycosyltransferase involved in cell wall biosynthesis